MRDFIPSILIAVSVIGAILVLELEPPSSGTVIAVLGPETTLRQTVTETDAYLVGQSNIPNGYILFSNAPDFPERLKRAGAIMVLDAAYSAGCVSTGANPDPTR
ncbi:MAG: hypothetical protein AAGJ68_13490 [Pseudomonadota bacterium]